MSKAFLNPMNQTQHESRYHASLSEDEFLDIPNSNKLQKLFRSIFFPTTTTLSYRDNANGEASRISREWVGEHDDLMQPRPNENQVSQVSGSTPKTERETQAFFSPIPTTHPHNRLHTQIRQDAFHSSQLCFSGAFQRQGTLCRPVFSFLSLKHPTSSTKINPSLPVFWISKISDITDKNINRKLHGDKK